MGFKKSKNHQKSLTSPDFGTKIKNMITQQTQIKINLPLALKDYLESKASKFDLPLASYVKHLIIKDVADLDYPIFQISKRSEEKAIKAKAQSNRAIKVTNVSEFFRKL
jgi:hypothetical protein